MLGIIIGIAAIIAIVSTITGTNEQIKNQLVGAGSNTVNVKLRQGGSDYMIYDSSSIPQGIPPVSDKTLESILAFLISPLVQWRVIITTKHWRRSSHLRQSHKKYAGYALKWVSERKILWRTRVWS